MAISKSSLLADSSRFVILAVDKFENGELRGIFYHESIEHGSAFESLMEAVIQMESIYDRINYPVRSMESRRFVMEEDINRAEIDSCEAWGGSGEIPRGKLATLRICVNHRYNASWQGYVVWEEEKQVLLFESFLELIRIFKQILEGGEKADGREGTESVCRVAVDNYGKRRMEGRIAFAPYNEDIQFGSIFQLMEQMERLAVVGDGMAADGRTLLQFSGGYRGSGHLATFAIRLLFWENATWQGLIYWREARSRLSFRSFLELVSLMDTAVRGTAGWVRTTENTRQTADI